MKYGFQNDDERAKFEPPDRVQETVFIAIAPCLMTGGLGRYYAEPSDGDHRTETGQYRAGRTH